MPDHDQPRWPRRAYPLTLAAVLIVALIIIAVLTACGGGADEQLAGGVDARMTLQPVDCGGGISCR